MKDFRTELKRSDENEWLVKRLDINQALNISIQASEYSYCSPRELLFDLQEYYQFELGFPNFTPPDYIMEYAENPDEPQETVYGYVPYELIQRMIDELRSTAC